MEALFVVQYPLLDDSLSDCNTDDNLLHNSNIFLL